jgi:CRISPR-associated protein Csd1
MFDELVNFYNRKRSEDPNSIAPLYYAEERMGYIVKLFRDGTWIIDPVGENDNVPRFYPSVGCKRSNSVFPYFLYDNLSYVLGINNNSTKKHSEWVKFNHNLLKDSEVEWALLLLDFMNVWKPEMFDINISKKGSDKVTFAYGDIGDWKYIVSIEEAYRIWYDYMNEQQEKNTGIDIVTGEKTDWVKRLHPSFSKMGGLSTGVSLVSFNTGEISSFSEYGKKQSNNAPMSVETVHAYFSAIEYLNGSGDVCENKWKWDHKVRVGDDTYLFWATRKPIADIFSVISTDKIDTTTVEVRNTLMSLSSNIRFYEDTDTTYYILGLTPEQGRLYISYWRELPLGDLIYNIKQYITDTHIEGIGDFPSNNNIKYWLYRKDTKSYDHIARQVAYAILNGIPFGAELYNKALRIVTVPNKDVTINSKEYIYSLMIIKGYLTRILRKEMPSMIDESCNEQGYLLGRIFALMEGWFNSEHPKANSNWKSSYYQRASTFPLSIFPMMINKTSHYEKKEYFYNSRIGELINRLSGNYPVFLSQTDRGWFSIGYYEQLIKELNDKEARITQKEVVNESTE